MNHTTALYGVKAFTTPFALISKRLATYTYEVEEEMSEKTISIPSAGYFIVYYDKHGKCIGGLTNNPECEWNYTGGFSGRDVMWIPQNFNPVGLTYKELKAIKDKHQAEQKRR